MRQRHRQEAKDSRKPPPEGESGVPKMNLFKVNFSTAKGGYLHFDVQHLHCTVLFCVK